MVVMRREQVGVKESLSESIVGDHLRSVRGDPRCEGGAVVCAEIGTSPGLM